MINQTTNLTLIQRFVLAVVVVTLSSCINHPVQPTSMRDPAPDLRGDASNVEPTAVDASPRLSALREPWQFAEFQGQLISTPNYRLYTTVESEDFLDRLPLFYEQALKHYTTALVKLPMPDVPLETFLFKNRSQWQIKTEEMLPEQSKMFSNLGRGGFTTRGTSVLYYIDRWGFPRDTFAIAAHEGWHQYTQETFKHQLPIWLEEGVATYMEGYRGNQETGEMQFIPTENRERRMTLREAVRDSELIALEELLTRTPQSFLSTSKDSLLVYYAQVWALTRFLNEGEDGKYKSALAEVLTDAAEGRLVGRMMSADSPGSRRRGIGSGAKAGPAVVREYFNRDLVELETQYLAFVNKLATEPMRRGR